MFCKNFNFNEQKFKDLRCWLLTKFSVSINHVPLSPYLSIALLAHKLQDIHGWKCRNVYIRSRINQQLNDALPTAFFTGKRNSCLCYFLFNDWKLSWRIRFLLPKTSVQTILSCCSDVINNDSLQCVHQW